MYRSAIIITKEKIYKIRNVYKFRDKQFIKGILHKKQSLQEKL